MHVLNKYSDIYYKDATTKNIQDEIKVEVLIRSVNFEMSFVFWENWRYQKDISKLTDL